MYLVFFSALACLSTCQCSVIKDETNHCDFLKWVDATSVSVEIRNKGFHRELVTSVQLSPMFTDVRVLLIHHWPRGVYIDPYQLASLTVESNWQILINSSIDLEAPAHKSTEFVSYLYPIVAGLTPGLQKVTIPVHGRYQKPSSSGTGFTSVDIQPPQLLLRAGKCTRLTNIEPHIVVDAPCTADNSSTCTWVKVQHQQDPVHVSVQFPVGDESLVIPVCGGTLLVTLICCMALSKYAWKHQLSMVNTPASQEPMDQ